MQWRQDPWASRFPICYIQPMQRCYIYLQSTIASDLWVTMQWQAEASILLLFSEQTLSLCFRVFVTWLITWCQCVQNMILLLFGNSCFQRFRKTWNKKTRNKRRALKKYCTSQECISSDIFIFAVSESTSGSTRNTETLVSHLSF